MTHWKKLHNADYFGAWDFQPNEERILTIRSVGQEEVTGAGNRKETCMVVRLAEGKPLIANATNCKAISQALGTPYIEQWIGKSVIAYVENNVKAFGEIVDAVRIRPHAPRIATSTVCEDCTAQVQGIGQRTAMQIAQYTLTKYGRILCAACATRERARSVDPLGEPLPEPLPEHETPEIVHEPEAPAPEAPETEVGPL